MLSRKGFERYAVVLYLFTSLCLLPCDWDVCKCTLTRTKYWLRRFLNRLVVFGLVVILIWFAVGISIDVYWRLVTPNQLIIILLLFLFMLMMVSVALACCFFDDFLMVSINTLFATNRHFRRHALNRAEREELDSRKSFTVQLSNVLELFAMVHSMCITALFFEDFDPFRRYFYNIIAYFLDLQSPMDEIPFVILYFCLVRVIYGYFLLLCFYFSGYQETMIYWLELPVSNDRYLSNPVKYKENVRVIFVSMTLLNRLYISSQTLALLFPALLSGAFVTLIISNFASIRLFGTINFFTYLFLPSISILLSFYIRMWSYYCGQYETLSTEFVRVWKEKLSYDRRYKRFLRACRQLFVPVNIFFRLNLDRYADFQQFSVDKTVELLVST